MHLNELRADNFKRLRAVRIEFPEGGGAVEICGSNGQGKSSTIDAIWAAMGGARAAPDVPIRSGARKAEVTLHLGDYKVVRTWDREGSRLTVTDATGSVQASPQAILDGLFNRLGFDPLEFVRLKPKDQADTLRRVVGLDFSEIDAERAEHYASRTEVNRVVKSQAARLETMPNYEPIDPVDTTDLNRKLWEATAKNRVVDRAKSACDMAESAVMLAREKMNRLKQEFEAAQNSFLDAEGDRDDLRLALREAGEAVDPGPIMDQIQQASAINERARSCRERAKLEASLEECRERAARLTDKIDDIDAYRRRLLAEAEMPVPGLSLEEDEVTLNGVPLAQASSAERIRIGLAMAAAMKPGLKLVAIREGSLLDEASLRMVATWAAAHGYQVLVERVAAGPSGVGVVIEDGAVTESRGVNARVRTRPIRNDVPSLFDQPHAADGGADLS